MKSFRKAITMLIVACFLLTGCGNKYKDAYEKGIKFLTESDYEQAITAFTEAIEIDPKQYKAYSGRARAYIATGKREEAVTDLCSAVEQGMKAEEIQEDIIGEVVSKIIEEYEDSAEEAAKYLSGAGFFNDTIIPVIPEELNEILANIITEFSEKGKSIEDLIEYLKNLGFIAGDEVPDLIKGLPAETYIKGILDYKNEGKTIKDLNNAGYGKASSVLFIGKAFRNDLTSVFEKMDLYFKQIGNVLHLAFNSSIPYMVWLTKEPLNSAENGLITSSYNDKISINSQFYGENGSFEKDYYRLWIESKEFAIYIYTKGGIVTGIQLYSKDPEKWNGFKNQFINDYKSAIKGINEIVKNYEWTISDIYDVETTIRFFESLDSSMFVKPDWQWTDMFD